jgi:polar amino acid transport system substrate-binding protein
MMRLSMVWLGMLLAACSSTSTVPSATLSELAPTGTLRIAINYGNAVLATQDRNTGELRGITVDLGREIGRRTGLPVELVAYPSVGKIVDDAKAGTWDIAFLAIDPARANDIAFTAAYMEVENTYLVPPGSSLKSIADVDRAGIRIAVPERYVPDLYLSRTLKNATLVRVVNPDEALALLVSGKVDAYASSMERLLELMDKLPGARILEGRFLAIQHAMGILKTRENGLAYLRAFIEDAKASGLIDQEITKIGIRGVRVAPLASAR